MVLYEANLKTGNQNTNPSKFSLNDLDVKEKKKFVHESWL